MCSKLFPLLTIISLFTSSRGEYYCIVGGKLERRSFNGIGGGTRP